METAFFYRRGLTKQDFMRAPLSVDLTTKIVQQQADSKPAFFSMPAMLGNYLLNEPSLKDYLKDCDDSISEYRDLL